MELLYVLIQTFLVPTDHFHVVSKSQKAGQNQNSALLLPSTGKKLNCAYLTMLLFYRIPLHVNLLNVIWCNVFL